MCSKFSLNNWTIVLTFLNKICLYIFAWSLITPISFFFLAMKDLSWLRLLLVLSFFLVNSVDARGGTSPCNSRCTKQERTIWSTDGRECRVFRNRCYFDQENCRYRNEKRTRKPTKFNNIFLQKFIKTDTISFESNITAELPKTLPHQLSHGHRRTVLFWISWNYENLY